MNKEVQEELKELNEENYFGALAGVEILSAEDGVCVGRIKVEPKHKNPIGSVHGGCLFTLADSVAGTAAYSKGGSVTTVSSHSHFLNAALDTKELIATAKEVKCGKRLRTFDVDITDENKRLISRMTFEFFVLGK